MLDEQDSDDRQEHAPEGGDELGFSVDSWRPSDAAVALGMRPASKRLFNLLRKHRGRRGEHQLAIAVLEDAIFCYQHYADAGTIQKQRIFHSAEDWLMRHFPCPLPFEQVCAMLNIDADQFRSYLLRWRQQHDD